MVGFRTLGISTMSLKIKGFKILFVHSVSLSWWIFLRFWTEHSTLTTMFCSKFYKDFSTKMDVRTQNSFLAMISQVFANAMTAPLSYHVQTFVAIGLLEFGWVPNKISITCELWWKTCQWNWFLWSEKWFLTNWSWSKMSPVLQMFLTHWGRVMHICVVELGHHWFR